MDGLLKAVFDTNILIDYLRGVEAARAELARHTDPAVSLITWMEVLVGARDPADDEILRHFLARFEVLPVTTAVAERSIKLRRTHRLRLPDAVIWATAEVAGGLLVTRNVRDFPADHPGIRVPYPASELAQS